MNRFVAVLLVALVAVNSANAFTVKTPATLARSSTPTFESSPFQATSSTSLNLKVKVDPDAKKRVNPGLSKGAAYGGSIAIAVALPLVFLVWAALK